MDKGERVAAQPGETDRRRRDKQTGDKRGRPFRKGNPGGPGRKVGVPNKATVVIKEVARELTLGNTVVVARLKKDAEAGTMHPRVFIELLHYGYGVPKETMAVEGSDRLGFQIVLTGPPHDPLAEPDQRAVEAPLEVAADGRVQRRARPASLAGVGDEGLPELVRPVARG